MAVDAELIHKLQRRLAVETSVLVGLASELVTAGVEASRLAAMSRLAHERAARYPRPDPISEDDRQELLNAQGESRRAQVQRVLADAAAANQDPAPLLQALGLLRDKQDFAEVYWSAAREAEAAYRRAETRLSELEDERQRRGQYTGALRQTLHEFDQWAQATGIQTEAA